MSEPIDWAGYNARKTQERAAVSAAQGNAVSPQAAVDALRVAPVTSVPAEVSMHDPVPQVAQAKAQENTAHLAASPELSSFVASSPAKAAAVGDDYAPLAKLAQTAGSWAATRGADFAQPFKDFFHAYQGAGDPNATPEQQARSADQIGILWAAQKLITEPLTNLLAAPLAKGLVSIPGYVKPNEDAAKVEETLREGFNTAGMFAAPGLGVLGRRGPRPPITDLGAEIIQPKRLPGPKEVVPDAEFVDIPPGTGGPGANRAHQFLAESDASHVTQMQEDLAATATHTRLPSLTEDFLANHTGVGDQSVSVPVEALTKLWAEGHEVFPALAEAAKSSIVTGGDVQIPLAQYLAETAGKPFAEELNAATRFREDGVSVEEAKGLHTENTNVVSLFGKSNATAMERAQSVVDNPKAASDEDIAAAIDSLDDVANRSTPSDAAAADRLIDTLDRIERQRREARTPVNANTIETPLDIASRDFDTAQQKYIELAYTTTDDRRFLDRRHKAHKEYKAEVDALEHDRDIKEAAYEALRPSKEEVKSVSSEKIVEVPEDLVDHITSMHELAATADLAVEQVFKESALDQLFLKPEAAGMTKGQMERYSARVEEAQAALHDKLVQRHYDQIRRERTPEWKAEVAQRFAEAEQGVAAGSALHAYSALRTGKGVLGEPLDTPFKLSLTDPVALRGRDLGLPQSMFSREGLDADDVAEMLGFRNGLELVASLAETHAALGDRSVSQFVKAEATARANESARANLGYDVSREGILRTARDMVADPIVEDLLTSTLRDFAEANGLPFDKAAVRALAQREFDKLPVAEAMRTRTFVDNMRRLGNKAEVALMDGKDLKAFTLKQQQLLQYHQVQFSQFLARKVGVTERKFAKLAKRQTVKGLAQPYLDQLHSYLPRVGFTSRRNPLELGEALNGITVERFVNAVIAVNPAFPEVPLASGPLRKLPVSDFWTIRAFVYAMDKFGREVQTVKTAEGKMDFEASVERLLASAPPAGARKPPRMGDHKNFFERQAGKLRAYDAAHRKIADIGEFFDRGKPDGVMAQVLEYPIEAAADKDGALRRDTYKPVHDAFWDIPAEVRGTYNSIIPDHPFSAPDGTPMEIRRGDVPAIALYVGQESALEKLAEGYGTIAPDVLQFLDEHLTEAEVNFVQTVWDKFEDLSVEVSAELRAMTGTGLAKEPNRAWRTPFGVKRGGYWPVKYDKALDRSSAEREAERAAKVGLDPVNQFFMNVVPDKGFATERTSYSGPVLIRLSDVASAFDGHIKYAAYAQTVASIRRFINDKRVAGLITSRMGPEYYAQFNPWLDAVVLDYTIGDRGTTALQSLAHQARINTTMSVLGFSYTTGISQVAGLESAAGVVGNNFLDGHLRMAHGMARFARSVAGGNIQADMFGKSEFMAQRFGEVEPNMVAAINASQGLSFTGGRLSAGYKALQNAGLAYIGWMELTTVSGPAWFAGYDKAIGDFAMSEGDAIRYADRMVRKSQGSGRRVDLAAVQRGDGFQRWFYMFNTWFNTQYQRMVETGREAGEGNYGKAFGLFATIFVLSPLIAALITNHGPKDGQPKTVAKWAAQSVFFNLFRPMFLLGNITSTLDRNITAQEGKWTSRPARDLDFSADPITRMASAVLEPAVQLASGKKVGRPVQSAAAAVGIPFGIPGSVQVGRTGEYLYELTTGAQNPDSTMDVLAGLAVGPQAGQSSTSTGAHK